MRANLSFLRSGAMTASGVPLMPWYLVHRIHHHQPWLHQLERVQTGVALEIRAWARALPVLLPHRPCLVRPPPALLRAQRTGATLETRPRQHQSWSQHLRRPPCPPLNRLRLLAMGLRVAMSGEPSGQPQAPRRPLRCQGSFRLLGTLEQLQCRSGQTNHMIWKQLALVAPPVLKPLVVMYPELRTLCQHRRLQPQRRLQVMTSATLVMSTMLLRQLRHNKLQATMTGATLVVVLWRQRPCQRHPWRLQLLLFLLLPLYQRQPCRRPHHKQLRRRLATMSGATLVVVLWRQRPCQRHPWRLQLLLLLLLLLCRRPHLRATTTGATLVVFLWRHLHLLWHTQQCQCQPCRPLRLATMIGATLGVPRRQRRPPRRPPEPPRLGTTGAPLRTRLPPLPLGQPPLPRAAGRALLDHPQPPQLRLPLR